MTVPNRFVVSLLVLLDLTFAFRSFGRWLTGWSASLRSSFFWTNVCLFAVFNLSDVVDMSSARWLRTMRKTSCVYVPAHTFSRSWFRKRELFLWQAESSTWLKSVHLTLWKPAYESLHDWFLTDDPIPLLLIILSLEMRTLFVRSLLKVGLEN